MKINKILKMLLFIILTIVVACSVSVLTKQPKITYEIKTYELDQNVKDSPMEVFMEGDNGLGFKVIFSDDRNNSEKARLVLKTNFIKYPPFLEYGYDLTVQLINTDQIADEDQVTYEVQGKITGLRPGLYKLKIIDPNSNLVDERTMTVGYIPK